MDVPGFERTTRTYGGGEHEVFVAGEGPGVLVMHEVPGLHPEVIRFGRELVEAGFTVWMPVLFGTPGKPASGAYTASQLCRACISREFTTWRTGRNSPVTDGLRELARQLSEATGGTVGALGMCLTGGFALAMMVDPWVTAPVLSQPSLPFAVFPWQKRDVGVDAATLEAARARVDEGVCVLGLRYQADPTVPAARFDRLRNALGPGFEAVEIPGRLPYHSVLTLHRHEESVQRTLAFFREHAGRPLAG